MKISAPEDNQINLLDVDGGAIFEPRDLRPRIAIGGAFQGHVGSFQGDRIARSGQERRRFRPSAAFQLGQDTEFGIGADAEFVAVGHVAAVVALIQQLDVVQKSRWNCRTCCKTSIG